MSCHGTIVWTELDTWDVEAAKAFYAATLGWRYEPRPMADGATYWLIFSGERMVGGMFGLTAPEFEGIPSHWFSFIEVDDVDARTALVEAAGGALMRPAFDVADVGRIAIVKDASGAVAGWMTSVRPG